MSKSTVSFLLLLVGALPWVTADAEDGQAEYLFVKSANSIAFDNDTLALKQVSPTVVFFSDRPKRIAGHLTLDGFLVLWDEGEDSFAEDPPNATLSIIDGGEVQTVVMELKNPRLQKDTLLYDVRILEGDAPASGGTSSLFIDGVLGGAGRGAALGAVGGAIAGDAGKGAAIGAGVGAAGALLRGN